jgi:hypothetical protein
MPELDRILALLEAGNYWPALSLALLGATHLVRRGVFDRWLDRLRRHVTARVYLDQEQHRHAVELLRWGLGHLRAFVVLGLAGLALLICVLLPWDVTVTEAAYTVLLGALGAMGANDTIKAVGAGRRVLRARPQRPARPRP